MDENSSVTRDSQVYYLGIDVHKSSWVVTIRSSGLQLKTVTIGANAEELKGYLQGHYPDGVYYSAYEAGFSGFSTHQQLCEAGIQNIVVHAADVPRSDKEKQNKTDVVDSRKLARHLEQQQLVGIYVPERADQEFRSLVRLRQSCSKEQTRLKNRIKSLLYYYGLHTIIPAAKQGGYWSAGFLQQISDQQQKLSYAGAESLKLLLQQLVFYRQQIAVCVRSLRQLLKQHPALAADVELLQSVPGIGFSSAVTLRSELIDIHRFGSLDQLSSFVGLVPSVHASSDRQHVGRLSYRCNSRVRLILIESAWVAIRNDAALLGSYRKLVSRMKPQQAIIRIARKLLNRIRHVWLNREVYRKLVV